MPLSSSGREPSVGGCLESIKSRKEGKKLKEQEQSPHRTVIGPTAGGQAAAAANDYGESASGSSPMAAVSVSGAKTLFNSPLSRTHT